MITFVCGLLLLAIGGLLYGRFVERFFGITDNPTPAYSKGDGIDYVPMSPWRNGLVHLLNIAGTGPILGPIQGILFGPVAFITIPLGCILAGAVQDYMVGMISMRNSGEQIQSLVKRYLGRPVAVFFGLFVVAGILLFGATCIYTPGDIFVKGVLGQDPVITNSWVWIVYGVIFLYYAIATLLPIDKIIGRVYPIIGGFFIFSSLLLFVFIFLKHMPLEELTLDSLQNIRRDFFPIFFVTVACGIASGFHSTQATIIARTVQKESQGRRIFYNMMLMEGFIAMVWAGITMGAINLFGVQTSQNATVMLADVLGSVLNSLVPAGSGAGIGNPFLRFLVEDGLRSVVILGVVVLPITSGDTALRGLRLICEESLQLDGKRYPMKRLGLALCLFTVTLVMLAISKFSSEGFQMLWRYFAWANQTIVVFALGMATAWCIEKGKSIWVTVLPGAFYVMVTASFIIHAPIGFNQAWPVAYSLAAALAVAYVAYFIRRKRNAVLNENR